MPNIDSLYIRIKIFIDVSDGERWRLIGISRNNVLRPTPITKHRIAMYLSDCIINCHLLLAA